MANATVVDAWQDGTSAYLAIRVAESGNQGNKEYIGTIRLDEDLARFGFAGKVFTDITAAQKKTVLIAVVKAVRDTQLPNPTSLGITGTVTV